MAREVLSNGVINPDKYQADWYADLSNNWNLLNNLIGSAISSSEVDTKIATAIQELMVRTFQIVTELPETGTEGVMYLVSIPNTSKYTAYVWENNAYRELGVIQMTITIDDELSTTSENPVQNKVITNALGGKASSSHTHSASDITSGLSTVATSGSYNDLSNKPTIPTVNDATLTIQRNGTTLDTFTANASVDKTINISTTDDTKIPLAGTNALAGSIVPDTDNAYDFGDSTYGFANFYVNKIYLKGSTIFKLVDDSYICVGGATAQANGANLVLNGKNRSTSTGEFKLEARDGTNTKQLIGKPDGTLTWGSKNVAMQEDVIPRSGGAVLMGTLFTRADTDSNLIIRSGPYYTDGASLQLKAKNQADSSGGRLYLNAHNGTRNTTLVIWPTGEVIFDNALALKTSADNTCSCGTSDRRWTEVYSATGTINTSDVRLKNNIKDIDNKLLDAWGNIEPKQYKFNNATEKKGEKARFHTGYLAQDIQAECEKQGVNASDYGLFCHDSWEEQEEKKDENGQVIESYRPKGDLYSLRYEEALVVECAYLRKCIKELRSEIEQLKSSK